MTRRLARPFAIVGLALAILGAVGALIIRTVDPVPMVGAFGFSDLASLGYVISGLTWASIGGVLVVRRPENTIGWLMVVIGVGYAVSQVTVALTFSLAAVGSADATRLAQGAGWATVLLQLVAILQLAIGFLFPTGRVQSPGWGRFMRFVFWPVAIAFVLISLTQPGPLQLIPSVENPFGFGPDLRGGRPIAPILAVATLIVFVALVISMTTRYRSARQVERQQMKWFVLALGVSSIGLGVVTTDVVILNRPDNATGLVIYVFLSALVPAAIGIAILRHGLYDIDRIVSRTLAYATVTGVLAVVFSGVIVAVSWLLTAVAQGIVPAGQAQTIAVAISTLVVFALFQPVRHRVQRFVDRRFDRTRYDADRTVQAFSDRLRYDADLAAVHREIVDTATAAVRPTRATVWLR